LSLCPGCRRFTTIADVISVERYTPVRRAEFLLSTAVDTEDYARAVEAVRQLGLDPATIPHQPPEDEET
jgi:hypothetical protein